VTDKRRLTSKLPTRGRWESLLSTRRNTIALAALVALAALGVLLVFMSNYRDSLRSGGAEISVLVADRTIDEGTSGDVIAEAELFRPAAITEDEAVDGAVTDASALRGMAATEEIHRGQQLTTAAFGADADPVLGKLVGSQRALTVPVEAAQGNVGQVEGGSRVDVLGGFGDRSAPVLDVLARDVFVLGVHSGGEMPDDKSNVVLRVTDVEATRIAFASDQGEVWLTLRPPTLAKDSDVEPVQLENVLAQPRGGE
jgi:Flp pilus assembly protein CpaB